MATIKSRLEQLEAKSPTGSSNYCLVAHSEDCANDQEAAAAAYRKENGCEPEKFINVIFVSAQTNKSICGCSLDAE